MGLYDSVFGENKKSKIYYYLTGKQEPNPLNTMYGFLKNYNIMNRLPNIDGKDKYFHADANANAGQNFDINTALGLSVGKEIFDMLKKNIFHKNGLSFMDNLKDSYRDIKADMYGLEQGIAYPDANRKTLIQKYRPKGLDEKY